MLKVEGYYFGAEPLAGQRGSALDRWVAAPL